MRDEETKTKEKNESKEEQRRRVQRNLTDYLPSLSPLSRLGMMRKPRMRDLIGSYFERGRSRDRIEVGGRDGGGVGNVDERVGGMRRDGGGFGRASRTGFGKFDGRSFREGGLKVGWGGWERTKRRESQRRVLLFLSVSLVRQGVEGGGTDLVASCGRRASRTSLYLYLRLPCRGFLG